MAWRERGVWPMVMLAASLGTGLPAQAQLAPGPAPARDQAAIVKKDVNPALKTPPKPPPAATKPADPEKKPLIVPPAARHETPAKKPAAADRARAVVREPIAKPEAPRFDSPATTVIPQVRAWDMTRPPPVPLSAAARLTAAAGLNSAAATAASATAASAPASGAARAFPGALRLNALEVLKHHGLRTGHKEDLRAGLPKELLADRLRMRGLLEDLRRVNPPAGAMTVMQRRMPTVNDAETVAALGGLRAAGTLDTVTAVGELLDDTRRREAQRRCADAVLAMDQRETSLRAIGAAADVVAESGSAAFWAELERVNLPAVQQYRAAARRYADHCLDRLGLSLTPEQRTALPAVLGQVQVAGSAACMGARVARDRFLTARHCLYHYDEALGQWQPHGNAAVRVALMNAPDQSFEAEELNCTAANATTPCGLPEGLPPGSDHLVLRLKGAASGPGALPPMPRLKVERPVASQMLVVPGRSVWIEGRELVATDPVYMTTPGIAGCLVSQLRKGCVVNACQSEQGFSGAPMFVRRRQSELVLVGIFLGSATGSGYGQCQFELRNFGAALPAQISKALGGGS